MHKQFVNIQMYIHTSCLKCYLTHHWYCPKHIYYMHVLYTELHIACMYCINSEQLLVMFVKRFFLLHHLFSLYAVCIIKFCTQIMYGDVQNVYYLYSELAQCNTYIL